MDKIYKITFPNGKVYIGRTNDITYRMYGHKRCAFHKNLKNSLYKAMRKYGEDNWVVEIICEVESTQSQKIEEEFIIAYNSVKGGYNDTYTGGGGDLWVGRRDTKEYMDWIQKMKEVTGGENNGMYGKNHKTNTLDKLKEKAKGRFTLDWYKQRNGDIDGERLYEERRIWLKNRNLKKDENGKFVKSSK